jgi:hypothetical protein
MDKEEEIPISAIMYELQQIRSTLATFGETQQKILKELGGNGGPGIRTRLHSVETGFLHLQERINEDRLAAKENKKVCDARHKEIDKRVENQEKQLIAMRNIGVGVALGLAILEALRWIIPLLSATPTP